MNSIIHYSIDPNKREANEEESEGFYEKVGKIGQNPLTHGLWFTQSNSELS